MHAQTYRNTAGYVVILIGLVLSLVSALVPHFEAGYHLSFSVFAAGISPYLVYGVAVPLSRGAWMTIAGLLIVLIHAWLVYNERIIGAGDYSNATIYYVPVMMAIAALPLVINAFKKTEVS